MGCVFSETCKKINRREKLLSLRNGYDEKLLLMEQA